MALDVGEFQSRGFAFCQHERRSAAGLFCRQHYGGCHHQSVPLREFLRDLTYLVICLQGQEPQVTWNRGRELAVRYLVEGSIQRQEDQLRVTAQLIEASSGKHLWVGRYDRQVDDVFAIQDEITGSFRSARRLKVDDKAQPCAFHSRSRSNGRTQITLFDIIRET